MPKTGRRPGPTQTREQILAVARSQFADRGYTRTTIRSVADAAGVHPALLHHYFGTKEQLYSQALDLPVNPSEVLDRLLEETPREQFTEAFVRHAVATWRDPDAGARLRAMTRHNLADPDATALMRAHWQTMVIPRIATALDIPEGNVAAASSCLLGLVFADALVGIAQLSRMNEDELVALAAPVLDHFFHPPP